MAFVNIKYFSYAQKRDFSGLSRFLKKKHIIRRFKTFWYYVNLVKIISYLLKFKIFLIWFVWFWSNDRCSWIKNIKNKKNVNQTHFKSLGCKRIGLWSQKHLLCVLKPDYINLVVSLSIQVNRYRYNITCKTLINKFNSCGTVFACS